MHLVHPLVHPCPTAHSILSSRLHMPPSLSHSRLTIVSFVVAALLLVYCCQTCLAQPPRCTESFTLSDGVPIESSVQAEPPPQYFWYVVDPEACTVPCQLTIILTPMDKSAANSTLPTAP